MAKKGKVRRRFKNSISYRTLKYAKIRSLRDENFSKFAQKYALRTLYSIVVLIVLFVLAKEYMPASFTEVLTPIAHDYTLMFSIFFISESILGLLPPDIFIMWAAVESSPLLFISILALLSYIGGVISFLLGKYIGNKRIFERLVYSVREQYEPLIMRWGGLVIVLAALTPIPFSPISMLSGSLKFPFKKYVVFSLTRIIRVILYGLVFMMF